MLFGSLRIVFSIVTLVSGYGGCTKKDNLLKSTNSRKIRYHFHCVSLFPSSFNLEITFVRKGMERGQDKRRTVKAKGDSLSEISASHLHGHCWEVLPHSPVRFLHVLQRSTNCSFPRLSFEGCSYNKQS